MKKTLTIALLLSVSLAHAQYFQNWFNRSLLPASSSDESFYDGMRTVNNYGGGGPTAWFNVGYGTTMKTPFGGLFTDEARYVRAHKTGAPINANVGTKFADVAPIWFNTHGHAICEINNGVGNGGYLAVGNVESNPLTGAVAPGGSDALFYKINAAGNASSRFRFDVNSGSDFFTDIIASKVNPGTYYVCGYTQQSNSSISAIVMSIQISGGVNWFRTYQFDPTWPAGVLPTAQCTANALAEDAATGNIIVVGTIRDLAAASGNNGLVFSLTSAGALINVLGHHMLIDDQYHDIIQKANGNFAICGFSGDGNVIPAAFYGIWLTEITPACALINSSRYMHAIQGAFSQSKGFSIIERKNVAGTFEYYIAGPDYTTTGMNASINKISAMPGNAPIAWYMYGPQSGFFEGGYSIDYSPAIATKPGLLLLSNTNTPLAVGPFTSSYMVKTYFNGTTCTNYNPNFILNQQVLPIVVGALPDSVKNIFLKIPQVAVNTVYINGVLCTQNPVPGGSNARIEDDSFSKNVQENSFSIFPNPATDVLNININTVIEGVYTIDAIDITGRATNLGAQYLEAGDQYLQTKVGNLAKGIYTLQIKNGDISMTQKFVIQ